MEDISSILDRVFEKLLRLAHGNRATREALSFKDGGIVAHHTGEGLEQELRRRIAIQRSEQERIYFEGYDDEFNN